MTDYQVRGYIEGQTVAQYMAGPFLSRTEAERCAGIILAKPDVIRVEIVAKEYDAEDYSPDADQDS